MEQKSLEVLMLYTTFHIGVYVSLTTVFIGASVFNHINHGLLRWAVGCFLVAGACGGMIAANAAEYVDAVPHFFTDYKLKIWCLPLVTFQPIATLEHLAFWAGLLPISIAYLFRGGAYFKKEA
jgi:hypothetical protein